MITAKDIKNLAHLARIEVIEDEMEKLAKDMTGILSYVSEISVSGGESAVILPRNEELINIFRSDEPSHEKGEYTEEILANAPMREGNYIKVKKIL